MPGEFYIEDKKQNETLDQLHGEEPVTGSAVSDWQAAESGVVSIGEAGVKFKIHDLTLSIHNLIGDQVTVRLYKPVNGIERCCYRQIFDTAVDPAGLPVINGTWALHDVLRVTLESNNVADNGKAVDYDYMLEAM
ncbi:hypothetical protein C1O63_1469 [Dehalococcoides mccartyi]|uniref:hypothetical protein n=1 Tax=Dehalococcoides mccartyi TaxID=61435 RepID=UPI000CDF016C|nr:hypothetical protein [Dehalococcoides mccartyi]POZ58504.1 hypothetical protein C1O63_1469 [Dehalococcoides mccartyi]